MHLKLIFFVATPRGKKSPVPGKTTKKSYHSLMGDPDISWYLGLDPDVKPEDVDEPRAKKAATVEVIMFFKIFRRPCYFNFDFVTKNR